MATKRTVSSDCASCDVDDCTLHGSCLIGGSQLPAPPKLRSHLWHLRRIVDVYAATGAPKELAEVILEADRYLREVTND